jgi:penicillin-binding protein 1C
MPRRYLLAGAAAFAVAAPLFFILVALTPRFDKPISFSIYDRKGELLGAAVASDGQWRLPPGKVPAKVAKAIVTFEDRRFYLHPGVDPLSLARALYQNATTGRVVSGGSTITMQTARLLEGNPPRTVCQKLGEAALAALLEARFTKREILSTYAANAPFGGNVVGLEAASWRYFNRAPGDLTWAEAATLAVLPNQPSLVNPSEGRSLLLAKRDALLASLSRRGFLNESDLALALAEPLPEEPYPLPRKAPHYLELMKRKGSSITSIDSKTQTTVAGILERWSARFASSGIRNAAAIVIETGTGRVLAYVGNTGALRADGANADVDVVQARRSSGSVLKPFLYGAMLDAGLILPEQLVVDIPTRVGSYKPENNLPSYQGVVPADEALSRSLNVPAIRELRDYGIAPFLETLRNTGFTTFTRTADEYGLPLILGGGEVTLEEATRAYAALMNRASGKKAKAAANSFPESPLSRGAAWLTLEALVEGTRPSDEALWQSFASARKIAWKTGTSYGNRDAWAIGVTPTYAVGVWVGNATGEGRPELKSISTAAPVLFDLFSILPASHWPEAPEAELEIVKACAESGYPAGPDCAKTTTARKPAGAKLGYPCPYCRTVSLTEDGLYQATAGDLTGKYEGELPLARKQFVLPPAIERWYVMHARTYRKLPPWIPGHRGDSAKADLSVVFPESGARVFIPVDLDGSPGSLVLQAAHRDPRATLYWDIDGEYLGETRDFHQLEVRPKPGKHVLTITDERGARAIRSFEVLGE